jgi:hypothetical protein
MRKRIQDIAVAVVLAVTLALGLFFLLSSAEEPVDVGIQSLSGYAFRLEDDTGSVIFSVSDSGGVDGLQTLDADGAVTLNDTMDVDGNITSGTGAITMTDDLMVDGAADAVQLTVQGYTTQTSNLVVFEQSDGTDVVTVGNGGALGIEGDLTFENDETISNANNGTLTATVASDGYFVVSTGNFVVGDPSGASLTINGLDAYIQGNLEADGNTRLDGDVTLGVGDLTMSNGHIYKEFEDLTVTDGETITPTDQADIIALDSGGAVTITIAACSTDGHELTLIGDDNNTITINATNLRTTDGNALDMGQYDVIKMICQDTEWLLMLESNNQ